MEMQPLGLSSGDLPTKPTKPTKPTNVGKTNRAVLTKTCGCYAFFVGRRFQVLNPTDGPRNPAPPH